MQSALLVWYFNLPRIDVVNDVMRRPAINRAANALRRTQNLLHTTGQLLRKGLGLHRPCDVNDLVQDDIPRMLDVLLLFAVPWRLCQDDQHNKGSTLDERSYP